MTTIDLSEASFMDYTVEITNATVNSTITFSANDESKNRFFLDEVKVVSAGEVVEPTQVAAPTFSVAEGSYVDAQSIELFCATADASIFYTINNGVETIYEAPIELSENGEYVIKAWAKKEGLEDSEVVTKTYTIDIFDGIVEDFDFVTIGQTNGYPTGVDGAVGATPTFTSGIVTVSTQEGGTPNRFWSNWKEYRMYNGATLTFSVPTSYTIVKIELTPTNSPVQGEGYTKGVWNGEQSSVSLNITGSAKFTDFVVYYKQVAADQVLAPTFSLTSGTYFKTQELSLSCETEGAKVFYTIDNGEGVSEDREYLEPIQLTNGIYEINAWATKDGFKTSSTVSAIYEIKVIPFEEINVENVKEGKYIIAYNDVETGKSYIMKNEVISDYYVGAEEFDLTTNTPAETDLFVVKQTEGGYTIQNSGNTYVALIQSGKFTNLKPQETDPFVWNFAKSENGNIVATGQGIDSYMSFKMYNTTPEFLAEKNGNYPMFYFVSGTSSVNDAVANEFKAVAVVNGIEVNVAEAGLVSVYNAAGQLVANVNVAEGATTINVAGGFYIVKAGNNVAKVLVK